MSTSRWFLLAALVAGIAGFFLLDLDRYFTLEYLQAHRAVLTAEVRVHPLRSAGLYAAIYVAVTALSLPGAALMTLVGGAVFGLGWGIVIVSFASTLGATLAFLATRLLFREAVRRRFGPRLAAVETGMRRDGPFYLFSLRLVPVAPFFLVNLLMGLTPIRAWTFYWVSQLGMLPGTIVYVNAGRELGRLDRLGGIVSPSLLASFAALAVFPWLARGFVGAWRGRRAQARWARPRRFDRNLIVIGAGAAGLVTSYIAAAVRAKVTLIERHRMGGDCLNYGCVPSKTIIHVARVAADIRRAQQLGILVDPPQLDFTRVMDRVQATIAAIAPHDSVARYTALGVECISGEARIVSPWEIEVNDERLTTRAIVIAAGAEPAVPPIPGLASAGFRTSETVWDLRTLPRRLLVLGGGPVGCELAQCFARLGSTVTLLQRGPRLLPREDDEVSDLVRERLAADGVRVLCSHALEAVAPAMDAKRCAVRHAEATSEIECDEILVAIGRRARTAGYGLEALGIGLTASGTIDTDECLRTVHPNVYACGDVAGPLQFTHVAGHQAWHAAVNALFGRFRRFRVDYSVIPTCTFVDPAVARVGLNEREARVRGIAYEVTRYDIADLDRAITDGATRGFVKAITRPGSDRLLGVTIVAEHAGEMLAEMTLAVRHGLGLNKILATVHAYPTFAEANKYTAGAWKRARAPERLLRWLARYHAWERG